MIKICMKNTFYGYVINCHFTFSPCFPVFSILLGLLWFFLIFKHTPVPSALVLLQVEGTTHCMDEDRKKIWSNWMKKKFRKENDSCTWWFNIMETKPFTTYYIVKLWKNTLLFVCHNKMRAFWVWAEMFMLLFCYVNVAQWCFSYHTKSHSYIADPLLLVKLPIKKLWITPGGSCSFSRNHY